MQSPSYQPSGRNQTQSLSKIYSGLQSEKPKSKTITKPSLANAEITWLFDRFLKIWGADWAKRTAGNQDGMAEEWGQSLAPFSRYVLDKACDMARDELKWAPNSPAEFKQFCLSVPGEKNNDGGVINLPDTQINSLISRGSDICKILKKLHPEKNWFQIADELREKKREARKLFPSATEIEMLRILQEELLADLRSKNSKEKYRQA